MKTTRFLSKLTAGCAIIAGILYPQNAVKADEVYTWTPDGTEQGAIDGGSGIWNLEGLNWWDGTQAVAKGANGNPFGTTTEDAMLIFNGSGTITKWFTTHFGATTSRTHTLYFTAGSNYTLLGDNNAFIGTGTSNMAYRVDPTATLTLGGNDKQLAIISGSDTSAGPGLIFEGGGVVNLYSGALLRNNSRNSRLTVRGGVTMNFNAGSVYTGPNGTYANPTPTDYSRIAVEEGVVNINGGTINAGYAGGNTAHTLRGFGISIGATATGGPAVLNINSGNVLALGDPRGDATAYAGIGFGLVNTNKGGIVNLNGGTLTVTNIRAISSLETAILNLNGGTIVVSTALAIADASITDEQLQFRLDRFIFGFANTDTNHVAIGPNGVTIDTSQIDAVRTNGRALVHSPIRGEGGLTKVGANSLALLADNTYTGTTIINGGVLEIGNGGSAGSIVGDIVNNASLVVNRNGTWEYSGVISGTGMLTKAGSGTFSLLNENSYEGGTVIKGGELTISSDASLGAASSAIVFENDITATLATTGNAVIESNRNVILNGTALSRIGTRGADSFVTLNGEISGSGILNKVFVGTLALTNGNTYTGGTIVTTGLLLANNTTGSATGSGMVSVNYSELGAALGGTGIIAPDAGNSVYIGGKLAPGVNGEGVLTFNFQEGSALEFFFESVYEVTLGSNPNYVHFASTGDWLVGSGEVTLSLALGEGFQFGHQYVLFDNVTTAGFEFANVTGIDGYSYSIDFIGNSYVITVVPEPATMVLAGLGFMVMALVWMRRRSVGKVS